MTPHDEGNPQQFPTPLIETVFGNRSQTWAKGIQDLSLDLDGYHYKFYDTQEWKQILEGSVSEGMRIYWREMLLRAHQASSTSIVRGLRWLQTVDSGLNSRNLLCVAAGLRGLLESAGDVFAALSNVPRNLAQNAPRIAEALRGEAVICSGCQELEDCLVHYAFATKLPGKKEPSVFAALPLTKYLAGMKGESQEDILKLYRRLCEWVHPSMSSVWAWMSGESELASSLCVKSDERLIAVLAQEFRQLLPKIPMLALNPGIVTLAVLNRVGTSDMQTKRLDTWDLGQIALWGECSALLESGSTRN